MNVPPIPKIYHIVHVDRLPSIISDGCLWCDTEIVRRNATGTTIGMSTIKQRRLNLALSSHRNLRVGECVPFYFCPRSIMLYLIWQANHPELNYKGGQNPIIHLEADLYQSEAWAIQNQKRYAFTLSNAGSHYFEDRSDLNQLHEIDWVAVQSQNWKECKENKQAEFLIEDQFPFSLVQRIGVYSQAHAHQVNQHLSQITQRPIVEVKQDWYY